MPRCDFCGSRIVKWVYRAQRDWLACQKCHAAIRRTIARPCSTAHR